MISCEASISAPPGGKNRMFTLSNIDLIPSGPMAKDFAMTLFGAFGIISNKTVMDLS